LRRFGGALSYTRGAGGAPPAFRPIAPPPALRLLVVNTRVPKDTAALVAGVRALREALPAVVEPLMQAIGGIAAAALGALEGGGAAAAAHGRLCALVRANQGALCALGVGHAALDGVVAAAARRGLAAKLTGAGGGGCALVLLPPGGSGGADEDALAAELEALGYPCFLSRLGGDGVVVKAEGE
jgi:mevalonate kinase